MKATGKRGAPTEEEIRQIAREEAMKILREELRLVVTPNDMGYGSNGGASIELYLGKEVITSDSISF